MRLSALVLFASTAAGEKLDLQLNTTSGEFNVILDGVVFLNGGSEYMVDHKTSSSGAILQTAAPKKSTGSDKFGNYSAISLSWGSSSSSTDYASTLMTTTFKQYSGDDGLIVFEQSFPAGIRSRDSSNLGGDSKDLCRIVTTSNFKLTDTVEEYNAYTPSSNIDSRSYNEHKGHYCDDNHVWAYTANVNKIECQSKCDELNCTCFDNRPSGPTPSPTYSQTLFPSFSRVSPMNKDLDLFAYHGIFPSMKLTTLSKYEASSEGGAPVVIYDADNASLPMVVFSPLNYPKAQHFTSTGDYIGAGVKAPVTQIPVGWTQSFLLSASRGINKGMMDWGDRMLKFTSKARADMYKDDVHGSIGFWTDNGGYYHYSTGTNKSATYEDVLPQVKKYHDNIGVPFKHWQFDSWFYPKDGGVNPGGGGGAVVNWTAMPEVFPSGMAAIQEQLGASMPDGMPMVMHNRQWSIHSDYIHNLSYAWYTSKYAIPEDPVAFFDWFFQQQKGWGLSMYEQDWMCTEYDNVGALRSNISMGDLWLSGMATGATKAGLTIQYCMPYPYDVLHAAAEPAVTNARATGDYFHAVDQWNVANTALFYWPIGVLPFKDGFYSSSEKQIGGQTAGPETSPDREIIMATLSCAMVGPMDGINLLNKTRTMASCNSDGLILKPDRPIMTSDACFLNRKSDCHIAQTYSDVKSISSMLTFGRIIYLFSSDSTEISDAHFFLDASKDDYIIYNWYTESAAKLEAVNTVAHGYEGHSYAIAAPITGSLAFVGEPDKYTTASAKRFGGGVTYANDKITAEVAGEKGETVRVCAIRVKDMTPICTSHTFDESGSQVVEISA